MMNNKAVHTIIVVILVFLAFTLVSFFIIAYANPPEETPVEISTEIVSDSIRVKIKTKEEIKNKYEPIQKKLSEQQIMMDSLISKKKRKLNDTIK